MKEGRDKGKEGGGHEKVCPVEPFSASCFRCAMLKTNTIINARRLGHRAVSFFSKVERAPPDPILSLTTAYHEDPKPQEYKINLGVGAYRDGEGKPWVLESVRKAERLVLENPQTNHEYIPILGTDRFVGLVQKFLFQQEGMQHSQKLLVDEDRIVTGQGISGTGSLKVVAEFLAKKLGSRSVGQVAIPSPSWANHASIFAGSGLRVGTYRYYDSQKQGLDLVGLLEDLAALQPGDAVLLHVCCHNPTGVDPTGEEWDKILQVVEERQLLPIFDMAYQGFSKGVVEDLAVVEKVCKLIDSNAKIENAMLSQSFAKNLGLYGERVGSFSLITADREEKSKVQSQLKQIVRSMYSSPPCHGSKIVEQVLGDEQLYSQWCGEVTVMRDRLKKMRLLLFEELKRLNCHGPGTTGPTGWEHLVQQHGMFCFTGLTPDQVAALQNQSIYLTKNGRISVAGINEANVGRLSRAIAGVFAS